MRRLLAAFAVLALPLLAVPPARASAAAPPPIAGAWRLSFTPTEVRAVGMHIPRGQDDVCATSCAAQYQFTKAGVGETAQLTMTVDPVGCPGAPCDVRAVPDKEGYGFDATLHYDGTSYSGTGQGFFGASIVCAAARPKGTDSIYFTVDGTGAAARLTGTITALLSVVQKGSSSDCRAPDGYEVYSGPFSGAPIGLATGATGATGLPGTLPGVPVSRAAASAGSRDAGSAPALSPAALAALPAERRADILADRAHSRPTLSTRVASARDLPWRPSAVLASALLAMVLVVLMPFPAALFNATLENHYDEVRGWFRFLPARHPAPAAEAPAAATEDAPADEAPPDPAPADPAPADPPTPQPARAVLWRNLAVLALATGVLDAFLDPHLSFDTASAVLVAGLALSVLAVSLLGGMPLRTYVRRRYHEAAHLRLRPLGFAVAAVCVLVSRLASFQPGYLYGVVAGFAFARELEREEKGRVHATTAAWLLGVAVVAFAVRIPVHHALATSGGAASTGLALVDTVLAAVFAAGIEGNVLGLLPVRFLPGEEMLAWSRVGWAVVFGLSLFAFLHALAAQAGAASTGTSVTVAVGLFGAFATVSVAFWAYFRFRPTHPTPASV